jgi:hypothetical protein
MESGLFEPDTEKTEYLPRIGRVKISIKRQTLLEDWERLSRIFMKVEGKSVMCLSDTTYMIPFS